MLYHLMIIAYVKERFFGIEYFIKINSLWWNIQRMISNFNVTLVILHVYTLSEMYDYTKVMYLQLRFTYKKYTNTYSKCSFHVPILYILFCYLLLDNIQFLFEFPMTLIFSYNVVHFWDYSFMNEEIRVWNTSSDI